MSFSSNMKENLSKIANLSNKELVKYEFIGYLISNNTNLLKNSICYSTSNEYNINRFSKLLSNLSLINFQIELKARKYRITLPKIKNIEEINYKECDIFLTEKLVEKIIISEEQIVKAFVRGVFLGSGSINNPENKYHMEIIINNKENAKVLKKVLENVNIHMKEMERKRGYSLYLKEGEEISKFLALIGANSAVLKFEEIRVLREMKNKVNRKVNCETANLSKTIQASVKQIEAIKKLQKHGNFESLPNTLKEIAILRLENPAASLTELGKMLKNPIGKSGVNHRLKQIEELGK